MSSEIIVAVISFIGTLAGAAGGVLTANRLVSYRLSQLEERVKAHNSLDNRLTRVEAALESLERAADGVNRK